MSLKLNMALIYPFNSPKLPTDIMRANLQYIIDKVSSYSTLPANAFGIDILHSRRCTMSLQNSR